LNYLFYIDNRFVEYFNLILTNTIYVFLFYIFGMNSSFISAEYQAERNPLSLFH